MSVTIQSLANPFGFRFGVWSIGHEFGRARFALTYKQARKKAVRLAIQEAIPDWDGHWGEYEIRITSKDYLR